MLPILFLKAHVRGYTRQDGTVVEAHDDGRKAKVAKPAAPAPLLDRAEKANASRGGDEQEMHEVEIAAGQNFRGTHHFQPQKYWMSSSLADLYADTHKAGKRTGRKKVGDKVSEASPAPKNPNHHPHQHEMHKHLEEHGWREAGPADEAKFPAYADARRKQRFITEGEEKGDFRPVKGGKEHREAVRHYVHDDRPDQTIRTSPADGDKYSVWQHDKHLGNAHPEGSRAGMQFMGGMVGKTGNRHELAEHLESGRTPKL